MKPIVCRIIALALFALSPMQMLPGLASGQAAGASTEAAGLEAPLSVARTGRFNGQMVRYRAAIEGFPVTNEDGSLSGRIAAISYVASDGASTRPVLFIFNGGPITSSATLHMGAFGPKRVAVPADPTAPLANLPTVDNLDTVLDVADLVFFDPEGTGLSRFARGTDPARQFGVVADARQLQQLVLAWTKAHHRENSPYYLVGESYGTMRAPEAAKQLAAAGRPPAGLILVGQAVNIIEYAQREQNLVSYAVSLPTMAAIAWWHDRADRQGRDFQTFFKQAQAFAATDYLTALFAGDTAPVSEQRAISEKLRAFTGIPTDYWLAHGLRMTKVQYRHALLPGKLLATNDARYVGPLSGPDPFEAISKAFVDGLQDRLANDFALPSARAYTDESPFKGGLNDWRWGPNVSPFGDWPYGKSITEQFASNPNFKLYVANGYYDTQTTIGAMDLLFTQSGWPRTRAHEAYFEGGHMFYTVDASRKAFLNDVRAMVTDRW